MDEVNLALVVVGGVVVVTGLVSKVLRQTVLSIPLLALLVGVVVGPVGLAVLDPAAWGDEGRIVEEAARVTLAIGLMGVALRLPRKYFAREWRTVLVLLGLVMPLMWLASGLVAFLALGVPVWVALLIGAVVTPTDPVVASSIVTGEFAEKHLPERLRQAISAESGANDGLAYLFVLLPILWLTREPAAALHEWGTHVLLVEVVWAIVLGVVIGLAAGKLLMWSERHDCIEAPSFFAYTIALSLLTLGGARLLGGEGIVAVFVAGVAFDHVVGGRERAEEERVQEAINRFFLLPVFVLLGLVLPFGGWVALGWRGVVLAAAVLVLRRLPFVLALRGAVPAAKGRADAWALGWFGPIGVAAVYYGALAHRHTGLDVAWAAATLIVVASLVVHGGSAAPLSRLYARRTGRGDRKKVTEPQSAA